MTTKRENLFLGEEDRRNFETVRDYMKGRLPESYNKRLTVSDVVRFALQRVASQIRAEETPEASK